LVLVLASVLVIKTPCLYY